MIGYPLGYGNSIHIQISCIAVVIWQKLSKYLRGIQSIPISELLINLKHKSNSLCELKCIVIFREVGIVKFEQ